MIGQDVRHFRVLEKLGAGGMGEVFKAEDSKLHRFVALKFLPPELAAAKPARERFEREARAIAGLNHPNICTLYEYGEQAGKPYLVLELLEGRTLRERVQLQPPNLGQLIEWAMQMADALDFAHRRGIIHRDLKPANIFITQHNQAKILDFGLARLEAVSDPIALLDAETASLPAPQLTSPGSTLGTVSYMSPEQARSEPVDARSDIFSLGVVLYEAATGRPCFQAKSTAETFSRILNFTPPPPSQLKPGLPAELDRILYRALEKDPELRYQHAGDLRTELKRMQRQLAGAAAGNEAIGEAPISSGSGSSALAVSPVERSTSFPDVSAPFHPTATMWPMPIAEPMGKACGCARSMPPSACRSFLRPRIPSPALNMKASPSPRMVGFSITWPATPFIPRSTRSRFWAASLLA